MRAGRGRSAGVREARGLAAVPVHKLRGTDPNWSFERHRSSSSAPAARRRLLPARRPRRPAGRRPRRRRTSGCGHASSRRCSAGRRRSGSTAAISAADDAGGSPTEKARARSARRDGCTASATTISASTRTQSRAARAPRLRVRLDASASRTRSASGPGSRIRSGPGTSSADRPLDLVEIPLAAMDVTLAEERYLGLSRRARPSGGCSRCSTGRRSTAAASRSCGTRTASIRPRRAAGTASTRG